MENRAWEWNSGAKCGAAYEDVAWIDIETRKVEAPKRWPYKTRWQPFMAAIGYVEEDGNIKVIVVTGETDKQLIAALRFALPIRVTTLRYAATREFDEMVLKGRFTNARRSHSAKPGTWAHLDEYEFNWDNRRKSLTRVEGRKFDVASKDVPAAWARGEHDLVALHCMKDVVEMMYSDILLDEQGKIALEEVLFKMDTNAPWLMD